jgi:hypothetical protein
MGRRAGAVETYDSNLEAVQLSLRHALFFFPNHGVALFAVALVTFIAIAAKQIHVAHVKVLLDPMPLPDRVFPRL